MLAFCSSVLRWSAISTYSRPVVFLLSGKYMWRHSAKLPAHDRRTNDEKHQRTSSILPSGIKHQCLCIHFSADRIPSLTQPPFFWEKAHCKLFCTTLRPNTSFIQESDGSRTKMLHCCTWPSISINCDVTSWKSPHHQWQLWCLLKGALNSH